MTTRYRVEYHLKSHRRDELIEWIKALLVVPFVLIRQLPSATKDPRNSEAVVRERYAEVFKDVEELIDDHIAQQEENTPMRSKLKMLVPSIGIFFTPLPLREAFLQTDSKRAISQRRFVAPSFNGITLAAKTNLDIRRLLATAQLLALTNPASVEHKLQLITFDGDVTLYPDGSTLLAENPVIPCIIKLLSRGIKVGIVTAAGYPDHHGIEYSRRLIGLLQAISASNLPQQQKNNLAILGGECNYLFRFDGATGALEWVDEDIWTLDEMRSWDEEDIQTLLNLAQSSLENCAEALRLRVQIIRKPRAVGLSLLGYANPGLVPDGMRLTRECLEEAVLASQRTLSHEDVAEKIPFCCFNGGSDVWIDVGDKSLGVSVLQRYFTALDGSKIWGGNTLHVGDQFMSLGGNDFKAVSHEKGTN